MAQSEAQKNAPTQLVGKNAPLNKLPKSFPTEIDETLSLGLDLGVGSCGQALVYQTSESSKTSSKLRLHELRGDERIPTEFPHLIEFLGVRGFDLPEMRDSNGKIKLKNPERSRIKRSRRTTRRKSERKWDVKVLLQKHNLLPKDYPANKTLWKKRPNESPHPSVKKWNKWHSITNPLELRVKGLESKLEPLELAAALLHLAIHRGFLSNRKGDATEAKNGKVLQAISNQKRQMREAGYETFGQMLLQNDSFAERKRNREGYYAGTPQRDLQLEEIQILFKRQREYGNSLASPELEKAYIKIFSRQKPLQNSFKFLGKCSFETKEYRSSRYAPSFELSRTLQKLNSLHLMIPEEGKIRLADFVDAANGGYDQFVAKFASFGTPSSPGRISWKDLRKVFRLNDELEFLDLPQGKVKVKKDGTEVIPSKSQLEAKDFCTNSTNNFAAEGSYLLCQSLGDQLWHKYWNEDLQALDDITFAISFFEEVNNDHKIRDLWGIKQELKAQKSPSQLSSIILKDLNSPKTNLANLSGTSARSALASRKLIPELRQGLIYSEACSNIYGDHRKHKLDFEKITNPVVKSVVRECLKQVIHLIDQVGVIPGRINIELARDLGKSVNDRNEISDGLRDRKIAKDKNQQEFEELIGRKLTQSEQKNDLPKYEMWKEQSGFCPYCQDPLANAERIVNPNTAHEYNVDHILPRSRSWNDSFRNKVLVCASCNADKNNQTPFEWHKLGAGNTENPEWKKFASFIAKSRLHKEKKKNLLNTTFAEDEPRLALRHLNDTRYIARLVTRYLSFIYEIASEAPEGSKGKSRRVFTQSGALTDLVRYSWGLGRFKKDGQGNRIGDKHHAVDALICALLSEGQKQWVTSLEQILHEKDNNERKKLMEKIPSLKKHAEDPIGLLSQAYQRMETSHEKTRLIPRLSAPKGWENVEALRQDVAEALSLLTVSRRENRRGRGALHKDTLYRVEENNGQRLSYKRTSILKYTKKIKTKKQNNSDQTSQEEDSHKQYKANLTKKDLKKIKDIELPRNEWLKTALETWIDKGAPVKEAELPRDPSGSIIRKVTIEQTAKARICLPSGRAESGNGSIVRVDIFSQFVKPEKKEFYAVPIYNHQLCKETPPLRSATKNTEAENWTLMDSNFQFEFSLWKNSRFEIVRKNNPEKPIIGLYRSLDISGNCRIEYCDADDTSKKADISAKSTSLSFRKLQTDRLGRLFPVPHEPRMWRGQICDSRTHLPQVL